MNNKICNQLIFYIRLRIIKHDEYVYLEIVPFQFSYLLCKEIMAIGHWKGLVTTFSDVAT